jgi:hypothetical protein
MLLVGPYVSVVEDDVDGAVGQLRVYVESHCLPNFVGVRGQKRTGRST